MMGFFTTGVHGVVEAGLKPAATSVGFIHSPYLA
jgi:hypothetical protein